MADGSGEFAMLDDGTLSSGDSIMGEAVSLARLGPGKRLGPYLVLSRSSVGDAGVRYRAWDTRSETVVALRLLRPERDQGELREDLETLAAISHPSLTAIHEVQLRYGVVCVAEDDASGVPLDAWLATDPSWTARLTALRELASALAAVHAAGQLYRELAPAKISVGPDGAAKLDSLRSRRELRTPPGHAQTTGHTTISRTSSSESLSVPLLLIEGCPTAPAYLAPEQYAGEQATAASDQFSLCVILYEALYGERPFAGRTVEGLFVHIQEGRVRPPPPGSSVPRWLREVIVRGLAHDPAQRWPSMAALASALNRAPSSRRRWVLAAAAAALGLAFAAGFGLAKLLAV